MDAGSAGGREAEAGGAAEARLRTRLAVDATVTVTRPSPNVVVCTVRALDADLEPPRALWLDIVLGANDGGARALVLERCDDGEDRLSVVDLARTDVQARARLADDAWVRQTALRLVAR